VSIETADVVIIGSGIVGSSVAYHLAQAGCTNVLVIEREAHQGKGSTGKSMGGVRVQFSTPVNIQMSRYSIDFFSKFDEVVGHPADYRAHGYLFCATTESHLNYLKDNRVRQLALGVNNVELVSPAEISEIVPQLRADDILGGTFCPTDGFVDPHSVMMGFMLNARSRGARLWLDTQVTGIQVDPGSAGALPATVETSAAAEQGADRMSALPALDERHISGVMTSRGFVSTRVVVNAAGAWAAEVAKDGRRRFAGRTSAPSTRSHRTFRSIAEALSDGDRHVYRLSLSTRREGNSTGVERSRRDTRLQN